MRRLITGAIIYGLCFSPPIPFLIMSRPFAAILSGVFWFFSLQLLSSGNQGGAFLLYLVCVACAASSVRATRILKRERDQDRKATGLLHRALKQERGGPF